MAKKKAPETRGKVLKLRDGRKIPVVREDGRYWYCGKTRFLKTNQDALDVLDVKKGEHDDA